MICLVLSKHDLLNVVFRQLRYQKSTCDGRNEGKSDGSSSVLMIVVAGYDTVLGSILSFWLTVDFYAILFDVDR